MFSGGGDAARLFGRGLKYIVGGVFDPNKGDAVDGLIVSAISGSTKLGVRVAYTLCRDVAASG